LHNLLYILSKPYPICCPNDWLIIQLKIQMSSYLQYKLSGGELYQCRQPNPILSAWGEDPSSVRAISSLYRETSKTLDHQHRDSFRHENLVTAVTFGEDIKFPIADKLNTA